jgi:NAD(P)-dependent dehydrogenase (short-subunit alcohol dehydrogenase family)
MIMSDLSGRTTLVVGASRGLGRGIAGAFAEAGAAVVAVARTGPALAELATTSPNLRTEVADATDPTVAQRLLDHYQPEVLILVAGATPVMRPLQDQTWETFSVNWQVDVKITFTWLRAALLQPLPPGSRVVVVSSGAAINGSPASGGYAGSKATQRFIAGYAQEESRRAGLDITVTAVLPTMTPFGEVGRRGVRAYAARGGQSEEAYLGQLGELLTPEVAGSALVDLVRAEAATVAPRVPAHRRRAAAAAMNTTRDPVPTGLALPTAFPMRRVPRWAVARGWLACSGWPGWRPGSRRSRRAGSRHRHRHHHLL